MTINFKYARSIVAVHCVLSDLILTYFFLFCLMMTLLHTIDSTLAYIHMYNFDDPHYNKTMISQLPTSPSAERNKTHIFNALFNILPEYGIVLEIGSGSGQHCEYFAQQLAIRTMNTTIKLKWQPTDYVDKHFNDIQQRVNLNNMVVKSFILAPKILNLLNKNWESKYERNNIKLIYSSNVIHISEWQCSVALFRGSGLILQKDDNLILYGPFIINDGNHDSQNRSNMRFSNNLKSRNESWGVRTLGDLVTLANENALKLTNKINMPSNNYLLVFTKI
eukprot:75367_1